MLSVVSRPSLFFPPSSLVKPRSRCSSTLNYNKKSSLKFSSTIPSASTRVENEGNYFSTDSRNCSKLESERSYLLHQNDEQYVKVGLQKDLIPKHIAVILDGSRRWLKAQGKPLDYVPFFQTNALFADLCIKWGVDTSATFIYSHDNLQRGKEANELIFGQLERFLEDNLENFVRKNMRVLLIGERNEVIKSLQDMVKHVEEVTNKDPNPQLEWRLVVSYGGTRDLLQANRRLCEKAKARVIEPNEIDDAMFDRELMAGGAPKPELLFRTGGELRLSNYLIWHMALAEYYFLPIQAPEFSEVHFLDALCSFQQRDKNFGR